MKASVFAVFYLALICDSYRVEFNEEWRSFKINFTRNYVLEEIVRRYTFEKNMDKILAHNKLYELGEKSYKMGINQFADWYTEELDKLTSCFKPTPKENGSIPTHQYVITDNLPGSVDWRTHNIVNEIEDQGQCDSCYAFSATGSIEGQHALKHDQLISLSKQQLVDCSTTYGNDGCDGGTMINAFEYIKANDGIEEEMHYPYLAQEEQCKFDGRFVAARVLGYREIADGNETALKHAVATVGPVSVGIAVIAEFFHYTEGIFDEPDCISNFGHSVLVTGYGTENGTDYWWIKNSWGPTWGIRGYAKMARNKNNQCEIASYASYPIVL